MSTHGSTDNPLDGSKTSADLWFWGPSAIEMQDSSYPWPPSPSFAGIRSREQFKNSFSFRKALQSHLKLESKNCINVLLWQSRILHFRSVTQRHCRCSSTGTLCITLPCNSLLFCLWDVSQARSYELSEKRTEVWLQSSFQGGQGRECPFCKACKPLSTVWTVNRGLQKDWC